MPRVRSALVLALLSASALMVSPSAGNAAGRVQTLRYFDQPVSMTLTQTDGTVVTHAPFPDPQPGDVLDVDSVDYRGTHAHHAKHFSGSSHLRCVFGTGEPTCESHVAIGGSMLIFTGNPGTVTNGTGIYQGATGRVVSAKQLAHDATDVVARIHLRG